VADHAAFGFRYQSQKNRALCTERVDQVGFVPTAESRFVDDPNRLAVLGCALFGADRQNFFYWLDW